jgi:hypothetical protein
VRVFFVVSVTIEHQKIEAPEAQCRRLVAKRHQRLKARHAALITGDELAIDDR